MMYFGYPYVFPFYGANPWVVYSYYLNQLYRMQNFNYMI